MKAVMQSLLVASIVTLALCHLQPKNISEVNSILGETQHQPEQKIVVSRAKRQANLLPQPDAFFQNQFNPQLNPNYWQSIPPIPYGQTIPQNMNLNPNPFHPPPAINFYPYPQQFQQQRSYHPNFLDSQATGRRQLTAHELPHNEMHPHQSNDTFHPTHDNDSVHHQNDPMHQPHHLNPQHHDGHMEHGPLVHHSSANQHMMHSPGHFPHPTPSHFMAQKPHDMMHPHYPSSLKMGHEHHKKQPMPESTINHHHFHHQVKDEKGKSTTPKPTPPTTPNPGPRIHNPIPLGCLLTIPIFHPILPRNHLACLLSIPWTPNLI